MRYRGGAEDWDSLLVQAREHGYVVHVNGATPTPSMVVKVLASRVIWRVVRLLRWTCPHIACEVLWVADESGVDHEMLHRCAACGRLDRE